MADGCEQPYRELAFIYDSLVGDSAFECWRDKFDRLTRRYGIEYETAADVACGTGQAAAYLSTRCDRVYAVDASENMLKVAGWRVRSPSVVFLRQTFTGLDLPEKVQMLTCNFDSLNYILSEGELKEALARFAKSLAPGGFALFDMNTCSALEAIGDDAVMVHRVEGGVSIWESSWDPDRRINTLHMTNFLECPDGLYSMSSEVHRERSYDLDVIVGGLRDAGFSRVETFDARDLAVVGKSTRRVQFLARL